MLASAGRRRQFRGERFVFALERLDAPQQPVTVEFRPDFAGEPPEFGESRALVVVEIGAGGMGPVERDGKAFETIGDRNRENRPGQTAGQIGALSDVG